MVTYNQLKLIYDLSVIYGNPINMDDPEEAFSVLLIAFGIRISDLLKGGAKFTIDKGGKLIVERTGKRVVLRKLQQIILKTLGKKVTQGSIKSIIAKAPPVIGSIFGAITCGTIDYFSTKWVANRTLYYYRTGRLIVEYFIAHDRIYENIKMPWFFRKKPNADYVFCSQTLAKGCWIMVNSDKKIDQNKMHIVDFIYSTKPLGEDFVTLIKERVKIPVQEFLDDFNRIKCRSKNQELEIKKTIYYAMKLIAVSDGKISKQEFSILEKIASDFNINQNGLKRELEDLRKDLFEM